MSAAVIFGFSLVAVIVGLVWAMGWLWGFPKILKKMSDKKIKCSSDEYKLVRKLQDEDNWIFKKIQETFFSDSKSLIDDQLACVAD